MSQLNVDTIKKADGTGNLSVPAETGTVVTTASPSLGRRNLIINGAMQVAQRGTSFTGNGDFVVDRFRVYKSTAAGYTCTQADITSGDPFDLGFRSSAKMQNTTPDTASNAYYQIETVLEDQDTATSGWNYKSSSSYVTLSFWAKASVSQDYSVFIRVPGNQHFAFSYPLVADTWTKVTKVIEGNTNIAFVNGNSGGFRAVWVPFYGTDFTSSSFVEDAWATSVSNYMSDMDSTWASTDDATFEITGVQLEVGSVATPFEHRSYGEELAACQRYYYLHAGINNAYIGMGSYYNASYYRCFVKLAQTMRANPTLDATSGSAYYGIYRTNGEDTVDSLQIDAPNVNTMIVYNSTQANGTSGAAGDMRNRSTSSYVAFDAEL
jgi:hypothetical protein